MKIAIIGAGFFGSTIAIKLSKKHSVDLFEKEDDILNNASKKNQFRFHLGYHYPRSNKTIKEIQSSYNLFINFFSDKVFDNTENYYSVANKNSKISYKKYLKLLKRFKLNYKIISNKYPNISNFILTKEMNLNYFTFKKILKNKISNSAVNLRLLEEFNKKNIVNYDRIILCTYSSNNEILKKLIPKKKLSKYRYELIEKIIVELPKKFKNHSYVVVDGKFVCVDPYLGTKYHLLSDVKYSKLEVIKKINPDFKISKKKYLNNKINKNIKISNFKKFIKHGSIYLPFLKNAKYKGSFFVTRTIKENVEKNDDRTTEIKKIDEKFISILSGKWNTCVSLANKIEKMINK